MKKRLPISILANDTAEFLLKRVTEGELFRFIREQLPLGSSQSQQYELLIFEAFIVNLAVTQGITNPVTGRKLLKEFHECINRALDNSPVESREFDTLAEQRYREYSQDMDSDSRNAGVFIIRKLPERLLQRLGTRDLAVLQALEEHFHRTLPITTQYFANLDEKFELVL